ncbi:alpha-1,2-galactosyltransferase [Coccidioides immitis H538.4]|uniref:Alpha-1,2-galactosyltransferase n=1 Tax=Coccidioides immitis H538.4 TaxID=396776 RepID=A0A0J8RXI5_COCIT|nr:alpha-1,2-galactosyltransferase [Coccidioides immitis H538.4]
MQFALPPRKSSNPPLYARPSPSSALRRRQLKSVAVLGFIIISVFFFISHIFSSGDSSTTTVASGPKVVLVTVLDEQSLSDKYIQRIKQNREDYVKRHGYINFFASTSEYVSVLNNAPRSWASVPAVRHAMTLYPGSTYFLHLSPHSLIMDLTIPITSHVLDPKQLESLMLKDIPVVPPDSGEWAKFFLDAWFDPLYRRYNFAKAETHALDHIVQWHPTMLARLALVPQRILNSYSPQSSKAAASGKYREGDFLIRFKGCEAGGQRNCEQEMEPYFQEWAKKTGNDK